ncbi:hypothetical protein E2C01_016709 [Portunus trituberculatus]|uniref:Uncharacterized protein n=1 Tax=Portunus trituberculatus TaxID=210409 RepID=A0A5B7DQ66_PORTR|nr:hypothetical protein [Portunus trituberculatus]
MSSIATRFLAVKTQDITYGTVDMRENKVTRSGGSFTPSSVPVQTGAGKVPREDAGSGGTS